MITNKSITQTRGGTHSRGAANSFAFTNCQFRSIVIYTFVGAGQQRENPWCTVGAQRVHAQVTANQAGKPEGNHQRRTEALN
jgi:hypothetical protein